jgi:hypothetical protein
MGIVSGRSGVWNALVARFADPFRLVPRPTRLPVQCVPCILPWGKGQGRGADHPASFIWDGWSARAIPLSPLLSLLGIIGQPIPFTYIMLGQCRTLACHHCAGGVSHCSISGHVLQLQSSSFAISVLSYAFTKTACLVTEMRRQVDTVCDVNSEVNGRAKIRNWFV